MLPFPALEGPGMSEDIDGLVLQGVALVASGLQHRSDHAHGQVGSIDRHSSFRNFQF